MKSFLNKVFSLLTRFFPVSKKIWVFNSYPDFTDNPFGFFYKVLPKCSDVHFVWLVSDKSRINEIKNQCSQKNVSVYYKHSFPGLWYFLRAGFLFVSHGIFEQYRADKSAKIVVALWHGMPLKRICWMESSTTWVTYADYVVATSELFQKIMSQSFRLDCQHVLIVGQPRNDLLFEKTDFFEKQNINQKQYTKIGIWLPTYRYSVIQQRTDGAFRNGRLLFLTMDDLKKLNDFLLKVNQLLIVKLHPMDYLQQVELPNFTHLRILKQKDLNCQLYPLLGNCDYLLSDFSSVWLDYEILGKPIGFVCDDFEEYEKGRGFTVPNLMETLPGPIIQNLEELKYFISHLPQNKKIVPSMFNRYKDCFSSERLLSLLRDPSFSK